VLVRVLVQVWVQVLVRVLVRVLVQVLVRVLVQVWVQVLVQVLVQVWVQVLVQVLVRRMSTSGFWCGARGRSCRPLCLRCRLRGFHCRLRLCPIRSAATGFGCGHGPPDGCCRPHRRRNVNGPGGCFWTSAWPAPTDAPPHRLCGVLHCCPWQR